MKDKIRKIEFRFRYSDTMEDDDRGRWARVAYIGDPRKPFKTHEIAWISKVALPGGKIVFMAKPIFPWNDKYSFLSLKAAKAAIRKNFNRFIKDSLE